MSLSDTLVRARPVRAAVLPVLERMAARAGLRGGDAEVFWRVFELLTRESLDYAGPEDGRRFSGICRDGSPWQFCVVLDSRRRSSVRFLTEVGRPFGPLGERTALALERLAEAFALLGAPGRLATAQVLAGLCPPDDEHIAGLWVGVGAAAGAQPRLRLYANNGWGEPAARWLRLIEALRKLNASGFGARLLPLIETLAPAFSPAGFAVTEPASPPVCKLYLRPSAPPWPGVRKLARALLGEHAGTYLSAIEEALDQPLESLPARALLVSMSGSAAGGALDFKLDLCGHCLFDDDARPAQAVERLARSFGLDRAPYLDAVEDYGGGGARLPTGAVAFLGVGADAAGDKRINIYLTPPPASPRHRAAS